MSLKDDVKVTYVDDDASVVYDDKNDKARRTFRKIRNAIAPTCVLIFLAIGLFVPNSWGKAWLVFLAIPISEIFFSAILASSKRRIMYITLLLCIAGYIGISFFLQFKNIEFAWLKSLIVFLFIPIVSALTK